MASCFLDTSALAKLYHEEPGSEYVERIVNQPESKGIISRLSHVEMESVFAIKVRTGALDENGRTLGLRRLRADVARNRLTLGARHRTETLPLRRKAAETPRGVAGAADPRRAATGHRAGHAGGILDFSDALSRQTALRGG